MCLEYLINSEKCRNNGFLLRKMLQAWISRYPVWRQEELMNLSCQGSPCEYRDRRKSRSMLLWSRWSGLFGIPFLVDKLCVLFGIIPVLYMVLWKQVIFFSDDNVALSLISRQIGIVWLMFGLTVVNHWNIPCHERVNG